VFPEADRRCRQNWIDALVGVNSPLLQLLEVSPAASVEQAQERIAQVAKTPGAKLAAQRQKSIELLQQKNLAELEEIAWPVDVFPEGDPLCCQSWIDALVKNVNPFALQYLCRRCEIMQEASPAGEIQRIEAIVQTAKNSPGVEVDPAQEPIDIQRIEAIVSVIENTPGVEVDSAQKPIEVQAQQPIEVQAQELIAQVVETFPGVEVDRVQEPIAPTVKTSAAKVSSSKKVKASSYLDCPSCGSGRLRRVTRSIYWETSCTKCGYFAQSILYPFTPAVTGYKVGDWVKLRIKPRLATKIRRGEVVCIDKVQDDYLRFVNPNLNPALVIWARREFLYPHEVFPCEPPVVKAAETSRGVKTEATVSESAIAPAVKTSFDAESDWNPILTGIPLSDKFLARYSPLQSIGDNLS
jgi:ribosomal protein L37AE/L43A